MKKILVQEKLTIANAVILTVFIIILGIILAFFIFKETTSWHTRYEFYGFIGAAAIFIPLWLKNAKNKGEYVSELILTDETLTVVYEVDNEVKNQEVIKLEDINGVHAKLNANRVKTGNSISLFCETEVSIDTKTKGVIYFTENPTASLTFCSYSFMLRLLSCAKYLPNFTYEVEGNSDVAKEDVKHYALYGKRLPYIRREWISFMQIPPQARTAIIACFMPLILCFVFLAYLNFPAMTSTQDKEYVSLIESGYELYRNDMCEKSLINYDKALNIHNDDYALYYYRSLAYKKNRQYEKAIEEANKGIALLDTKSVYKHAKKLRFDNKDDIGLYTVIGDCNKKLERYAEAKKAYSYVIANVRYIYTDAYFQRGQCEYYLNQKEEALRDFYRHKRIVEKYLQDQATSEYKAKYPVYTQKHLNNINKWIEATLER